MRGVTPTTPRPRALASHAPLTPGPRGRAAAPLVPTAASAAAYDDDLDDPFPSPRQSPDAIHAGAPPPPAPPKGPPPLRQTLEAIFSNENLKQDRYLYDLISESPGGWVDLEIVLGFKKVRALKAKRDDVLRALRDSWLETWRDPNGTSAAVRRPLDRSQIPSLSSVSKAKVAASPAGGQQASKRKAGGDKEGQEEGIVASDVTRLGPRRWPAEERLSLAMASAYKSAEEPAAKRPRGAEVGAAAGGDPVEAVAPSKMMSRARGARASVAAGLDGEPSRRLTGKVKTFSMRLGLGKILCAETGRDVVVRIADLAGFDVGDEVSFLLVADKELGTPSGVKLRAIDASDADDDDDEGEEAAAAGSDMDAAELASELADGDGGDDGVDETTEELPLPRATPNRLATP
eukprot:CAMPEP_0170278358 /NCGR_PEP_ID=MMETSP0116_2-20130129/39184_1 /TAXON_ID=400756 /ORGANISM="Durinskia baltica, Strain CSIRO CS-38" /LENGTH=403 /DNA_ID=CAMNT_0010529671 /DNA_START=47 /DNA_END=1254 /DNA_ORIENTATION=+